MFSNCRYHFPIVLVPIYTLTSIAWEFQLLTSLPILDIINLSNFSPFMRHGVISHCDFNLHFHGDQYDSVHFYVSWLFGYPLVAQMVKCLPTMQETWVQSLGREDLLEKEMVTCSSILAWKIPWTEKPGRLQAMGSQSRTQLSDFTFHFLGNVHLKFYGPFSIGLSF